MIVAQNANMVSINACIQCRLSWDRLHQILSDYRQFSGVGGQVDFIRGAAMAYKTGRAIIAMPSVTVKKDGTKLSKITPLHWRGCRLLQLQDTMLTML